MARTVTKPEDDVSIPGSEWLRMQEDWLIIRTLLGGTRAMRDAGKTYLPQEEGETDKAYKVRLARSVLFNFFRRTVKAVVGKPFSKPLIESEDLSEWMKALAEDIDLQGNNITIFCKSWFEDAVEMGISHVLIDYPEATGQETKAEERAKNLRPYWILIKAEQVIGYRSIHEGGKHKLSQVRIQEDVNEPIGMFGQETISKIRVYDYFPANADDNKIQYSVWKEVKTAGEAGSHFVIDKTGFLKGMTEIPLVPLYTEQTGYMQAEPPLLDLAYLNVAHWQSSSDQRNIVHVASVPILFGTGWGKDDKPDKAQIGPNRMLTSTKEGAKLEFVEHSGKAIEAGRTSLEDLKQEMQVVGMELLASKRPGGITATEVAIDAAAADSTLKSMVVSLRDAIAKALDFTAIWMDEELKGTIEPYEDFNFTIFDVATPEWWLKANQLGIISKRTILDEAKRAGIISDSIDADKEQQLLAEEGALLAELNKGMETEEEPEEEPQGGAGNQGGGA